MYASAVVSLVFWPESNFIVKLYIPICLVFSDRTCTVLNVEGDAFGAGLLQFLVDRTSKTEEGTELTDVKLEGEPAVPAPEHSPLMGNDSNEGAKAVLPESVM